MRNGDDVGARRMPDPAAEPFLGEVDRRWPWWYTTIVTVIYHQRGDRMPHRTDEHWDCRVHREGVDRRWLPLYVRIGGRETRRFVRVGQVCPACGRSEVEREDLAAVLDG